MGLPSPSGSAVLLDPIIIGSLDHINQISADSRFLCFSCIGYFLLSFHYSVILFFHSCYCCESIHGAAAVVDSKININLPQQTAV